MTPIIQVIKSNKENKTDKSGYIFKICAANDNINNMKMHPTEWQEKSVQLIHLIRDWYLEYIRATYNSKIQRQILKLQNGQNIY